MIASEAAIPLAEATAEDELGGKAVQLGAAIRAGMPVPPGVALRAELVAAVAADEPGVREALAGIRRALEGPLAVRSSCIGEDSPSASFAGQHESRLGMRTLEQLAEAIRAVWASGHSAEASGYRRRLGLDERARMAVVVQRLIEAEVAGVLFTRHPVSGADERVIEAAWGLGESVVEGSVTPDRYRVARDGAVVDRIAGRKEHAVRVAPEGSTISMPVTPERVGALCLGDEALNALHRLATRCEESFEGPSDIEWALARGRVWLLQRRPLTTIT